MIEFINNPFNLFGIVGVCLVLLGIAMLLHVRKSVRNAHGKNRK